MGVSFERVKMAFVRILEELEKNRQYLNDLDAPIGDSDHGDSVTNAFRKVKEAVDKYPEGDRDIGKLLQEVGKSIIFSGGAAMGPLYGTAFMDAGKVVSGKPELTPQDVVTMWEAFAGGIARRGNAKMGEKTMYDTIYPMVESLKASLAAGEGFEEMITRAIERARQGMESTKDMLSLRGRSSRLGERSIGHIDPGAASSFIVIKAFLETLLEK
ncbi:MAG: dihydroxyacetone kinase subunit DhaL [Atribacterota bacterium]